jgi:peroxin-2
VDAELLDEELIELLRGQVGDALKYIGGGRGGAGTSNSVLHDWEAEISLALRAVLFKLTVWDHDATYGAALQNLKYTDARRDGPVLVPPTRWQKSLYGLATVGGRYLWAKWEAWLLEQDDGFEGPSPRVRQLSRWTSALSTMHAAAALASFLVFLVQGRYRTLLDRVLRMRLAPPTSQVSREVSFEYLNRQLVWHAFTEFLLFVLPLVGINRWRRWLARTWRRTKKIMSAGAEGTGDEKKGEYAFLPERTCAICYLDQNSATSENELMAAASSGLIGSSQTDITNPYEAIPCGCTYCFVCLATRIEREEGEGWTCLRCGALVKECKPWGGDVLEPAGKSTAPKTVVFADDVNAPSDGGHSADEQHSQVLVEADSHSGVKSLSSRTPSVASDEAGGSGSSASEDFEAEEEGFDEDADR